MGEKRMTAAANFIEVRNAAKRFGSVVALADVSFGVPKAGVLGLLGDNGAGKSTIIRVLSGVYQLDSGELIWDGEPTRFSGPSDVNARGVATVFQDLAVVDQMSIYRNMFLGREREVLRGVWPFRWMDVDKAREEAKQAIAAVGITIRSADEEIEFLSGGQRQSIAIARAVHFSAKLLILDEPTSALSIRQQEQVLETIRQARDRGVSVIFISHNVHHVLPVADRIAILRQGRTVAQFERNEFNAERISAIVRGTA